MVRVRYFRYREKPTAFVPQVLVVCVGAVGIWISTVWVAISIANTIALRTKAVASDQSNDKSKDVRPEDIELSPYLAAGSGAGRAVGTPASSGSLGRDRERVVKLMPTSSTAKAWSSTTALPDGDMVHAFMDGEWEPSVGDCNIRLEAVLQLGSITMQQGEIGDLSWPLLDRIASIAEYCPGVLVLEGDAADTRWISEALVTLAIPKERIMTARSPRKPSPPFPRLRVYVRPD